LVAAIARLLETLDFAAHVGNFQVGNLKLSLFVALHALAETQQRLQREAERHTGLGRQRQERFNRTGEGHGFLGTLPHEAVDFRHMRDRLVESGVGSLLVRSDAQRVFGGPVTGQPRAE
jgi:hypothetical protein